MQPFELPDFYMPWPARLNPNLQAARAHSKAWVRQVGILGPDSPQIWDENSFDRHDYARLCAYIHPQAPIEELNLMTDWNIWAFYVDDYFLKVFKQARDRAGAKEYLDRILLFMPDDLSSTPTPTNVMERGLSNLWPRTAPSKSKSWRARIIEDMRNLLEAFLWEVDSMGLKQVANPIEYIEMRRQVGAALWSADLVEHAMGVEIPERIAATRPLRVLKETFADGVHLRNDIFSYQREVLKDGELTNAVLVVERFMGVDTHHAVNLVNDMLTSRLKQFEHTARTELQPLFAEYRVTAQEQEAVAAYIRGLQDWQYGAHEWHIQTSRYLNPHTAQESVAHKFHLSPTGLGTMAIHLGTTPQPYRHIPYQKTEPTPLPQLYMPFKLPQINPYYDTLRQKSKEWARRIGIVGALPGDSGSYTWDERRLDDMHLSWFNALSNPHATPEQLELGEKWLVWSTYLDDYFPMVYGRTYDLTGAKQCHKRLSAFMPLGSTVSPMPLNPIERGLAETWAHAVQILPGETQQILRKTIEELIGSWVWEIFNRVQNHIPDPIDYFGMRRKTGGTDLLMVLPRLGNKSIPPEIHQTLTMQQLTNAAFDCICWLNDIFSHQKEIEIEGDIHNNAVLVIQNFLNCDRIQAIGFVNDLITSRMKQFEHIVATDLPLLFEHFNLDTDARSSLLLYVEALQDFISSTYAWHFKTTRYSESEFRRSIGQWNGENNGLAISAASVFNHSYAQNPA